MPSNLSKDSTVPHAAADAAARSAPAVAIAAGTPAGTAAHDASPHSPGFCRAVQLANSGDCQAALQLLRPQGRSPETMNAIGVCLMRLGKAREAVDVYQGMVMKPGCTWMRPEVPKLYKLNFATALLLKGSPAGCLGTLSEINEPEDPVVQKLRLAIRKWESQLSFLRRWDWRLSHVEPPNCQIELDFPPGEFFHSSAKPA